MNLRAQPSQPQLLMKFQRQHGSELRDWGLENALAWEEQHTQDAFEGERVHLINALVEEFYSMDYRISGIYSERRYG